MKRKKAAPKKKDGTPKPQKQWDVPPGERTSDPQQQQVERVLEEDDEPTPAKDKTVRKKV